MHFATRALLALLATAALHAQTPAASPWQRLEFVMGKWIGVAGPKDTPLGPGQGAFSFEPEIGGKILVRHNQAAYDSGVKHDDLMIVYLDAPDAPRAIYFDSEGHTIHYNLTFPKAETAVFESDKSQPGPRYRLTYWMENGVLNGKFEVAPPGADYKPYMNWRSKRS